MTKRHSSHGDYEVGYGKPPQHSQWPKGQSGNPKGRKKLKREVSLGTAVNAALQRPTRVRIGGKMVTMTVFEATIHALVAKAARDPRSFRLVMDLKEKSEIEEYDSYELRKRFETLVNKKLEELREEADRAP